MTTVDIFRLTVDCLVVLAVMLALLTSRVR